MTRFRHVARIACALSVLACAKEHSPTAPAIDTTGDLTLVASSYEEMEPTPEELAAMPIEFQKHPTILTMKTEVGFSKGDGAWAQGVMDYLASDAEQEVELVVLLADREIARKPAKGVASSFWPDHRSLITTVAIPLAAACGHRADGRTQHRAWQKFLVTGWKLFSWGMNEGPSNGDAWQGDCPPTPPPPSGDPGGGRDDPYDGGCEACQQWFFYMNGWLVEEWWECMEVEGYRCADNTG